MKRIIIFSLIAMLLLASFTGCNLNNVGNKNGIVKVYSFSGENDFIQINNGAIILTPELEKFVGGDLSFKKDELSGIKNYKTEFYFFKDGIKTSINNNNVSIEGSEDGISVDSDLGSTSTKKIFHADVWGIITKAGSLHFSLSGTFMNGEKFEYSITVDVKDIF